jgi:hypothetical protein
MLCDAHIFCTPSPYLIRLVIDFTLFNDAILEEESGVYRVLAGKPEGKRPLA